MLINKYVSATGASGNNGNTYATAYTFTEMINQMNSGLASGRLYNVFADGIYTRSATDTIATGGTAAAPVFVRGCRVATGDGYLGRDISGLLITDNMPRIFYNTFFRLNITAQWVFLESLYLSGSTSEDTVDVGANGAISMSKVINSNSTSSSAFGIDGNGQVVIFNNDVFLSSASALGGGIKAASSAVKIISNRVEVLSPSASAAVSMLFSPLVAKNLIIGNGGLDGILSNSTTATPTIMDNTIVGFRNGIRFSTGTTTLNLVMNNMITDNSGYGLNFQGCPVFTASSRLRDNVSGNQGFLNEIASNTSYGNVTGDLGGPETDYIDVSSRNYNLKTTSLAAGSGIPYPASIGAFQFRPSQGGETSYSF